jgi:hypothetical protein
MTRETWTTFYLNIGVGKVSYRRSSLVPAEPGRDALDSDTARYICLLAKRPTMAPRADGEDAAVLGTERIDRP